MEIIIAKFLNLKTFLFENAPAVDYFKNVKFVNIFWIKSIKFLEICKTTKNVFKTLECNKKNTSLNNFYKSNVLQN